MLTDTFLLDEAFIIDSMRKTFRDKYCVHAFIHDLKLLIFRTYNKKEQNWFAVIIEKTYLLTCVPKGRLKLACA